MHQRLYVSCKTKNIPSVLTPLQKFADCCSGQYPHPEILAPLLQQQNMHLLCLPGLLLPLLGSLLFLCHFFFFFLLFIVQSGKFILRLTEKDSMSDETPKSLRPSTSSCQLLPHLGLPL